MLGRVPIPSWPFGLLGVLLLVSPGGCASTAAQQAGSTASQRHVIDHYAIDVPGNFSVEDASPQNLDFQIFKIADRQGNALLTLYFGNHPQFPVFQWAGPPRDRAGGDLNDERV